MTTEDLRNLLINMLRSLVADEAAGRAGKRLSRAVRYDLAVRASEMNGDGCTFPACGCANADCARGRASMPADDESSKWDNRRSGER